MKPPFFQSHFFQHLAATFVIAISTLTPACAKETAPLLTIEATEPQIQKMLSEAAQEGAPIFKATPAHGVLQASPTDGGYRLSTTVSGERNAQHTGPATAHITALVGDSSGGTHTSCTAENDKPANGPLTLSCEMQGAFHVENAKPVVIQFGLGKLQGMQVTAVRITVHTGGARSGVWTFSQLIPLLLGAIMLGYWFFFIRR